MADQVDGDDPCKFSQRRPHGVPGAHAAGEPVQQQQRWPLTVALDLDVKVEVVEAHQATSTAAGFSASATTRQTSRCMTTFRARSVGTSTTCNPPWANPS